jgi:hypothetical protein
MPKGHAKTSGAETSQPVCFFCLGLPPYSCLLLLQGGREPASSRKSSWNESPAPSRACQAWASTNPGQGLCGWRDYVSSAPQTPCAQPHSGFAGETEQLADDDDLRTHCTFPSYWQRGARPTQAEASIWCPFPHLAPGAVIAFTSGVRV